MSYDGIWRKNSMAKQMNKKIVLENGNEYYGYGFGAYVTRV